NPVPLAEETSIIAACRSAVAEFHAESPGFPFRYIAVRRTPRFRLQYKVYHFVKILRQVVPTFLIEWARIVSLEKQI
uniref:Uncharacterized protein n=1 Tax=Romanomermis culicivorax TaxID=13658 RepID=A0A915IS52_ROMCU